ncbi:iron transport multicopper oxidase [Microdochium nivale]|nr:iron transport multicopper oxidase [Microdochium nivale]
MDNHLLDDDNHLGVGPRQQRFVQKYWPLALWIATLATVLLGLTGFLLGDVPNWPLRAATSLASPQLPSQSHLLYTEDIPTSPTSRPQEEYILSPSWNSHAPPTTREYNWTIADAIFNPDGVFRPMVLINNQFPGPLVEANDGDTVIVHVDNLGVNATSLHFHGLYQRGSNAMDGAVGVTQCAIAPGTSYTYNFTIRGQEGGTYWYHAHRSAQASDGLVGPVVVHNTGEKHGRPGGYASDRVVMVQDHYHNTTAELLMDYLQPGRENEEPVPTSALINGRGLRPCADFPFAWRCDDAALEYPQMRLSRHGRHRLRIINVGAFAEFNIQIDMHSFFVTEVDGTDVVHENPVHKLSILPGQRYSIVLESNQTVARSDYTNGNTALTSAFWLRVGMQTSCFTGENQYMNPDMRAIIRYVDDDNNNDEAGDQNRTDSNPTSSAWDDVVDSACRDLDTSIFRPVVAATPPPADAYIVLRASFRIGAWRLSRGFFNDVTWRPNMTSPTLHRFLDATAADAPGDAGNASASYAKQQQQQQPPLGISTADPTFFDPSRELILATHGDSFPSRPVVVDIAIDNFDDGAHPFHLHGHKFSVLTPSLRGAPPATKAELDALLLRLRLQATANNHSSASSATKMMTMMMLENPLRRDTVTVAGYEWVVVRVVLDNPGMWALHCHNAWHAASGMAMQILVGGNELLAERERHGGRAGGEVERKMCMREGVTRGARPGDEIWFGQFG